MRVLASSCSVSDVMMKSRKAELIARAATSLNIIDACISVKLLCSSVDTRQRVEAVVAVEEAMSRGSGRAQQSPLMLGRTAHFTAHRRGHQLAASIKANATNLRVKLIEPRKL